MPDGAVRHGDTDRGGGVKKNPFLTRLLKIKGIGYILLALAAGVALLLIRGGGSAAPQAQAADTAASFAHAAETRLEALGYSVCGVKCSAAVNLKSGYRYSYACDQSVKTTYNPDGSVASKETTLTNRTVTVSGGTALVAVKESPPEVEGIAVVCTGASSAAAEKLRALIAALYGLDEADIFVTN